MNWSRCHLLYGFGWGADSSMEGAIFRACRIPLWSTGNIWCESKLFGRWQQQCCRLLSVLLQFFQSSCIILTSPADRSNDSWRDIFREAWTRRSVTSDMWRCRKTLTYVVLILSCLHVSSGCEARCIKFLGYLSISAWQCACMYVCIHAYTYAFSDQLAVDLELFLIS